MLLKLKNNLTKKEYEYNVIDATTSKLYYNFTISFEEDMDEGEYTYYLFDGDKMVANGLLQVGDYKPNNNTYTKEEGGYIQYKG